MIQQNKNEVIFQNLQMMQGFSYKFTVRYYLSTEASSKNVQMNEHVHKFHYKL